MLCVGKYLDRGGWFIMLLTWDTLFQSILLVTLPLCFMILITMWIWSLTLAVLRKAKRPWKYGSREMDDLVRCVMSPDPWSSVEKPFTLTRKQRVRIFLRRIFSALLYPIRLPHICLNLLRKVWTVSVERSASFVDRLLDKTPQEIRSYYDEMVYQYTLPETLCSDITDRKSTRLNSSHTVISYAVFCLKKKNKENEQTERRKTI